MQHSNVWISASIWMKRLNWKEWRPEKDFEERSKNRIYWLITSKVSWQERWTKCPNVNQVQFKILGRKNSQSCQNPIFTWSVQQTPVVQVLLYLPRQEFLGPRKFFPLSKHLSCPGSLGIVDSVLPVDPVDVLLEFFDVPDLSLDENGIPELIFFTSWALSPALWTVLDWGPNDLGMFRVVGGSA